MCDIDLLNSIKHLQIKPKELCCKKSSTCWCNGLMYRMQHSADECMSPGEMLNLCGHEMNAQDIKYLKKLSSYKFNPESP